MVYPFLGKLNLEKEEVYISAYQSTDELMKVGGIMKRRKFLNHSMLAGLASLSEASSTMAQASTKDASIYNKYHDPARMLKLEGEYYRHYPVDFSLGGGRSPRI